MGSTRCEHQITFQEVINGNRLKQRLAPHANQQNLKKKIFLLFSLCDYRIGEGVKLFRKKKSKIPKKSRIPWITQQTFCFEFDLIYLLITNFSLGFMYFGLKILNS